MLPYREERDQRHGNARRKLPGDARQGVRAALHPGAGDDESPGRAPYSA